MKVVAVLSLCCVLCVPVLAFGPQDALAYRSPEVRAAEAARAASATQRQATAEGASGVFSTGARTSSKQTYSVTLQYRHDSYALAQAEQTLERAGRTVTQTTRDDVQRALLAHAALWKAQANRQAAQWRADAAQMTAKEVERKHGLGLASALDLEAATLDAEDATLALQQAEDALTSAQADATRYGFTDAATGDTLRFALAETPPEATPDFLDAAGTLRLAQARVTATHRDLQTGLSVGANYIGTTQFSSTVSSRGPSADVSIGYPSLFSPQFLLYGRGWTFSVTADVPINPADRAAAKVAVADAALAQARLARQGSDLTVQIPQARRAATAAAATLGQARERAALAQRRVAVAEARAKEGAASPAEVLNAQATQADADARVAEAWQAYVTAVGSYLDLVGGSWEVAL
jgi:outer membrane protein TolC